jgi:hypothetical protein
MSNLVHHLTGFNLFPFFKKENSILIIGFSLVLKEKSLRKEGVLAHLSIRLQLLIAAQKTTITP